MQSTLNWISIKVALPQKSKWLTSEPLLFIADNKVYIGKFHQNGFFYDAYHECIASTPKGIIEHGEDITSLKATHWASPMGINFKMRIGIE